LVPFLYQDKKGTIIMGRGGKEERGVSRQESNNNAGKRRGVKRQEKT